MQKNPEVIENNIGTSVDLLSYNSASNKYTFPCDGYVALYASTNTTTYAKISVVLYGQSGSGNSVAHDALSIPRGSGNCSNVVFVRKGMQCYVVGSGTATYSANFVPLV